MDKVEQALNSASDKINKAPEKKEEDGVITKFGKFCVAYGLAVPLNGKQYLKAEAWQYLAQLVGVIPSCECLTLYERDSEGKENFLGVKVITTLIRTKDGAELAKSTMVARCEEDWLKDKPDYAVYGMAQTRAISRAVRNVYGWVAVAAGYEATPYEEMPR